jgi:MFS family permease
VSQVGSQVTLLALPLTGLLLLHARAYEVALLATAETLPNLALGIPAGVWLDRVRRRPVMIAADLGRAAALVSVPAAWGVGVLTVAQLYAVALISGSFSVLFEVASQGYLPSVVEPARLIEANAKFETSRVVAWAAGPAVGGGLVSLVTAPLALLTDAASYLASAGLIGSLAIHEQPPHPPADTVRSVRRELREGARYVLRHRYLRPLLVTHALANLAIGVVWAIAIVYAVRILGLSVASIGLAFSLGQTGGFAGAVIAQRLAQVLGIGRTVAAAVFLFGPATLVLAVAPKDAAFLFVATGLVLQNLARALYGVSATSIRQALVPVNLQARAVGFTTTAGTGAFPLGTALGSALAAGLGLRQAMLVGGLISLLPVLPIACSPMRSLRGVSTAYSPP